MSDTVALLKALNDIVQPYPTGQYYPGAEEVHKKAQEVMLTVLEHINVSYQDPLNED